jgi:CRP-like cAMP-binding protein
LFADQTRLVSVTAAEATEVVHLPDHGLAQLVHANPSLYADFYALSHENLATALRLLANLATSPSEARVAVRLLWQDELRTANDGWVRVSQTKLAELVALSLPTLQRVLQRLQQDGLIELGYGRVRICDSVGLLKICGSRGEP